MQNEMCLQQPPVMNGEVVVRMFGLLVKQILDLRETLSFYEQELFAPQALEESAPLCCESASATGHKQSEPASSTPSVPLWFWPFPANMPRKE